MDPTSSRSKAAKVPREASTHLYTALIIPRHNGSELFTRCVKARPWWKLETDEEQTGADFSVYWGQKPFDWEPFYNRPPGAPRQLINRFRGNGSITVKDRLAINMRRYAKAAKLDPSEPPHLPPSFVIRVAPPAVIKEEPTDPGLKADWGQPKVDNGLRADFELRALREVAAAAKQQHGESMWIVKPPPLNRGRGIQVFKTLKGVEAFLKHRRPNSHWVVQKYIERPLLIDGRKFDIRLLVLVTPELRVFMYRDSYVRTASGAYDPTNVADKSIHLVNDAVQIQFETYGKFEDSNKLPLDALEGMELGDGRRLSVDADLWPAMKASVKHVFCCALSHHFVPAPPGGAMFELFGFDFMVDLDGRVLLIEVNTGPALCRHGAVLEQMLPQMVEEVFQKAIDPLFPPPPEATPPPPLDRFELVDVPRAVSLQAQEGPRPVAAAWQRAQHASMTMSVLEQRLEQRQGLPSLSSARGATRRTKPSEPIWR